MPLPKVRPVSSVMHSKNRNPLESDEDSDRDYIDEEHLGYGGKMKVEEPSDNDDEEEETVDNISEVEESSEEEQDIKNELNDSLAQEIAKAVEQEKEKHLQKFAPEQDKYSIREVLIEVPKSERQTGGTPDFPGPIGKLELISVIAKRISELSQNESCQMLGDLSKFDIPQDTVKRFIHIAVHEIENKCLDMEIVRKLPRKSIDVESNIVTYYVEIFHINELYASPAMLEGFYNL